MKNKYLVSISAGHFFTDMNYGALLAMLPFIAVSGGLSYAQIAGITFASSLASSLTQPAFGIIADKNPKARFMPFGVLLAGCGISLLGFLSDYYLLMLFAAVISGVGTAAYHPEGARMANGIAGKKKGGSMSIFTVGGTLGVAVGPLFITPALLFFGLRGSGALAFPALTMFIVLSIIYPRMRKFVETTEREAKTSNAELKNEWGKFLWLGLAIVCRSIITHSLSTFVPLYWVNELHQSLATSGIVVTFMLLAGAVAIIVGGQLADRFGMNNIVKSGWLLLLPSLFLLPRTTNPLLALLILLVISIGGFMINSPMVVLGQQYLPKNIGFASGITLGLGVSIGGLVTPLLGIYADIHDLASTFRLLAILPIIGLVVAFTTKPPSHKT